MNIEKMKDEKYMNLLRLSTQKVKINRMKNQSMISRIQSNNYKQPKDLE